MAEIDNGNGNSLAPRANSIDCATSIDRASSINRVSPTAARLWDARPAADNG